MQNEPPNNKRFPKKGSVIFRKEVLHVLGPVEDGPLCTFIGCSPTADQKKSWRIAQSTTEWTELDMEQNTEKKLVEEWVRQLICRELKDDRPKEEVKDEKGDVVKDAEGKPKEEERELELKLEQPAVDWILDAIRLRAKRLGRLGQ